MHNLTIYAISNFVSLENVAVFNDFFKKIEEHCECIKFQKCNSPPILVVIY